MTKQELADMLDVVTERAAALVAAGVRTVSIDGMKIRLAPPEPVAPPEPAAPQQPRAERVDPMHDPATYGLPPGAAVPGLSWAKEMLDAQANRDRELGKTPRKG